MDFINNGAMASFSAARVTPSDSSNNFGLVSVGYFIHVTTSNGFVLAKAASNNVSNEKAGGDDLITID